MRSRDDLTQDDELCVPGESVVDSPQTVHGPLASATVRHTQLGSEDEKSHHHTQHKVPFEQKVSKVMLEPAETGRQPTNTRL